MMQLKNILHLTKNLKELNLFNIIKELDLKVDLVKYNLSLEVNELKKNLEEVSKEKDFLKEENEKIKQTCVNLSQDMLLISKAIGQIYMLTEKAVIENQGFAGEDYCEICNQFVNKKKKEEYH